MFRYNAATNAAWEDVCEQIDWEPVKAAHRETRGLAEHDFEVLALMTFAAAKRWLASDLKIGIVTTEQRFLVTVPGAPDVECERFPLATKELELKLLKSGARLFKGFADLTLKNGTECDWKTSGDLGPAWRDRHQHSWQAKLTCWARAAKRFVFRGVERSGRTAEVIIDWPIASPVTGRIAYDNTDCDHQVRAAFAVRDSQSSSPWLRAMPHACFAFGRACEHRSMCDENNAPITLPDNGPLSYSGIEGLLLCPERYRLGKVLADNDEDSDSRTALGRAFHAGVAVLWNQPICL